jgi:polygalacturonase
VQVFSINSATDLTLTSITIDDSAGGMYYPFSAVEASSHYVYTDSLGANTDGFDIGSSSGITITGANVYNQDEYV